MSRKIFVNLPVEDLEAAKKFFGALGFSFNPQFTDETAACMVIGEDNYVMLLTRPKFKEFTPNEICDATRSTEALLAMSCDSRAEVDDLMDKVVAAGGTESRDPQDYGFMYSRSFQDLDGHIWEPFWMDPDFVQKQT